MYFDALNNKKNYALSIFMENINNSNINKIILKIYKIISNFINNLLKRKKNIKRKFYC